MRLFCLVLIILMGAGCAGLRPDPASVSALKANYPTAELKACGKRWHGMALCKLQKGAKYNEVGFAVQTYYEGVLTVDSKNCDVEVKKSYKESKLVPIKIKGTAEKNCLITTTITPKYPGQDDQQIQVHSFRGHLAVRVREETVRQWIPKVKKVTGNYSEKLGYWVGDTDEGRVVADGCGRQDIYNKIMEIDGGHLEFNLNQIMPQIKKPRVCMMEGFIRTGVFKDIDFNVFISKYDKKFTQLPVPETKTKGDEIQIKGDDAVSIVSMDDKFEVDMEAEFEWQPKKNHTIRLLTVKGRSVIGNWDVQQKKWDWKQ